MRQRGLGPRIARLWAALTLAALLLAACSDDGDDQTGEHRPGNIGGGTSSESTHPTTAGPVEEEPARFSPCDLLDGADITSALPWIDPDEEMSSVRQLARYDSGIDACRIGRARHVDCGGCDFGVVDVGFHAGATRWSFDQMVGTLSSDQLAPANVDDLGDRAVVAGNGHRYVVWWEMGDAIFHLSTASNSGTFDDVDDVVGLARTAAGNVPVEEDLGRDETVILPDACAALDRDNVEAVLGAPVVLARGSHTAAGVVCSYEADSEHTTDERGFSQVGLTVSVGPASDDVSDFLDRVAAGTYGTAEELPGVGERALLRPDEAEINGLIDGTTQFKVEGFLARRGSDYPPEALISLAESAATITP
jgi:hypothetical protein